MNSTTARTLRDLSQATGESPSSLVARAVECYRRTLLLAETNAAYARLREDPEAWAEERGERAEWECTLLDGLGGDGEGQRSP